MVWNYLTLLLVMLGVGALLAVVTVQAMAILLLRPQRMTDGRAAWRLKRITPGDLRMRYSTVPFTVRDEATGKPLKLAAWWLPCPNPSDQCAVLIHGYGDAKVGAIAWAPTLSALGYHILALDMRAHGESEGAYCTAGYFERHDVSQVIDQLKQQRPEETRKIILFGISLGAAVVAATAVLRSDLAAVVMECPYPDYELAAASHAEVLGAPGMGLGKLAFARAQRIAGADFEAVRPVDLIPRVPCPLMVIRSESDVFIDDAHAAMVEDATKARTASMGLTVYWNAENAHHVAALYEDPEGYKAKLKGFLDNAVTRA
jgi:pimeloyl-ACP methyl ester carboxylesterase